MASYLIRRFLLMLLTLFGISVLIFVMLRLVPGNIADILFAAAGMIDPAGRRGWSASSASTSRSDPVRPLDRRPRARRPRLFLS